MRMFRIALVLLAAPAAAAPLPDGGAGGAAAPELAPGSIYRRELESLDRRTAEVKASVTEHLATLKRLEAELLHRRLGGAMTRVEAASEMGSIYKMVRLEAQLDGRVLAERTDERGLLRAGDRLTLFEGPLAPRAHTLSVRLVYRGDSALFPYLVGYRFTVAGSHDFVPDDRQPTELQVIAREQGDPLTTPMEGRPALEFRERIAQPADDP
jgi:hypothetical protein